MFFSYTSVQGGEVFMGNSATSKVIGENFPVALGLSQASKMELELDSERAWNGLQTSAALCNEQCRVNSKLWTIPREQ